MSKKTYEDGIRECLELLQALEEINEGEFYAKMFVRNHIDNKERLFDKNNALIKDWDVMSINPDDDDWLDLVIRCDGKLIYASELGEGEVIRLRDCLYGSDNPSVIVGNLRNNRVGPRSFLILPHCAHVD